MLRSQLVGIRIFAFGVSLFGASCTREAAKKNETAEAKDDAATLGLCDPALSCAAFATSGDALRQVLALTPKVLAIGESHAPASAKVPSTTRRFREELLPLLGGKSSAIVLELWLGAPQCGKVVAKVAEKQQEVKKTQAPTNGNDYLALGDAAKALGIWPLALTPTCDDYGAIVDAGASDIDLMLRTIRRLTAETVRERLKTTGDKMVLAYGGALHNDLAPRPAMAAWSFGPELSQVTGDHYVELDLVTPEFVDDGEAWKRLPWYAGFHRERQGRDAVLITLSPRSYVLVFPKVEEGPR